MGPPLQRRLLRANPSATVASFQEIRARLFPSVAALASKPALLAIMSHVFISHVEEDQLLAQHIAEYLEAQGYRAWYYERDSVPGVSYLIQTGEAIQRAVAVLLIVSPDAIGSYQITKEIVRAHENGKSFIPVLRDISHAEMQTREPEWREALGAAASVRIPPTGLDAILPRIVAGLQFLGVQAGEEIVHLGEQPSLSGSVDVPTSGNAEAVTFDEVAAHPKTLVDRQIGPFLVRALLGQGGSGIVYRVRNPTLGREFALKLFYPVRPDLAPGISAIIASGVHALASLQHPNIVRIHDFANCRIADVDCHYLVMDYVDGKTLDEWSNALDVDDHLAVRVRVAHSVASALSAAHETKYIDVVGWERKGVFHGDVKPGNILVAEGHQPLLADFSMIDLRRLLDPKVVPPAVLQAARVSMPLTAAFGTPGFMAPEQEKDGVVNAKTDIYGLGMTFSRLFWERESSNNESADRLGDLSDLVAAMANRVPEARPRDMAEVVRLLGRAARAAGVKLPGGRAARP